MRRDPKGNFSIALWTEAGLDSGHHEITRKQEQPICISQRSTPS